MIGESSLRTALRSCTNGSRLSRSSWIFAIDQHEFSSSHAHLCLWISRLFRTILVRCETWSTVPSSTSVLCVGLRARHVVVVNRWSFMAGGEMRQRWHCLKVNSFISSCRWSSTNNSSARYVDVGFAVGRNTPYKHIVVNIHYFSILKNDNSGNQLTLSRKPYVDSFCDRCWNEVHAIRLLFRRKYHAGVMLGGTSNIYLKPKTHSK